MQDKTYIPGMGRGSMRGHDTDPGLGSMYSPSPEAVQGTYIPGQGIHGNPAHHYPSPSSGMAIPASSRVSAPETRSVTVQPRVLAGVLYSISKGLLGEIFPVYLGSNSVGRDVGCDIRLQEETVSLHNGFLQVVRYEDDGPYHITFTDRGSDFGSAVNGADARYETLRVNDGDILQIGRHYRLLLKVFNTSMGRLYEDEEFHDTSAPPQPPANVAEEEPLNLNADISNDFYAPSGKGARDKRTVMY